MKKYILFILLFFIIPIRNSLLAQVSQIDSLRYMMSKNRIEPLGDTTIDTIAEFLKRHKDLIFERKKQSFLNGYFINLEAKADSTQPLNKFYTKLKEKNIPLQGYYHLTYLLSSTRNPPIQPLIIVGIDINKPNGIPLFQGLRFPKLSYLEAIACFKNGLPYKEWDYLLEIASDTIFKKVNYEAGLLQGDYIIYNKQDTLYRTVFEHGSGYYKDFFPNGNLWLEGQVKKGYPDGKWQFYIYKDDREWYKTIVEEYEERKLISSKEFYSKEETERIAEQEKLIQKNKKKWWQFWK